MVRLYLFTEGVTEQTFADLLLKPHLANRGVYLEAAILIAHARKKGVAHRGGGRRYQPMKNDIIRLTRQMRQPNVFFSTMIDLYAIHSDFPGMADAEGLRHLPEQRVECLERAFAQDIGDPRLIPYIQLHEYEACLFSAPSHFRSFFDHHESQIQALQDIASNYSTPELIDDGQHTAPSKRIIAQFPDYEGAKTTIGPLVAEEIGLELIRARCPHFHAWVSQLETLAG